MRVDCLIFGSGFGGCLTASILLRLGYRVAVVDPGFHPRFAIGESSTPTADLALRRLCRRYDLPHLMPLTRYGSWRRERPELACGLKRGFSYYKHTVGQPFQVRPDHAGSLLVAASSDDEHGDTHWFRAEVDAYLAGQLQSQDGVLWEGTQVTTIARRGRVWEVTGRSAEREQIFACDLLIDASGAASVLPRRFQFADATDRLRTHSWSVFAHWLDVKSWTGLLTSGGADVSGYPFDADDAAQHHLLDGAWMWQLRFGNGVTSAGLAIDARRHPLDRGDPSSVWNHWLDCYPSLAEQFAASRLATTHSRPTLAGRLQRMWRVPPSRGWALLPNAIGFVDPLHSAGIAQTVCAIERLASLLEDRPEGEALWSQLDRFHETTVAELLWIDRLVDICYATLDSFALFELASMLYFLAATYSEAQQSTTGAPAQRSFLCCGDPAMESFVEAAIARLSAVGRSDTDVAAIDAVTAWMRETAAPLNRAGLLDPEVHPLYRHTAAR